MSDTSAPELNTGDFVRIRWPNGSELAGFIHISSSGVMSLNFGPDDRREERWMNLGGANGLHGFVTSGSVQVVGRGAGS